MCFSATASFAASGGLAAVGVASWQFATLRQKAVAAIPLLFAVQQLIEGVQWLKIAEGATSTVLGYAYLAFAYLLWPTFVPVAVYLADPERRWAMKWFVVAGAALSAYLLFVLASQPLSIDVLQHSLSYSVPVPFGAQVLALYVLVTCGSLLSSSKQYLRWFGLAVFLGASAAALVYTTTFASVWCFFAAATSVLLAFWIWREQRGSAAVNR